MDNWLNYHHLYYFRVIAAEGSIARAAARLRLGQPTLSAQLKQLEEKLGIRLFERRHKKLILTEHGRIALEYATEIFRMGSEMLEVLHDRLRPEKVHVQLGALDSISKHLIAQLVDAAHRVTPCSVSLLEGDSETLARELLAHRIDLILTNHPPNTGPAEKRLFVRSLGKTPVIVCGAEKFKHVRKGFPKSLDGVPMVMPTRHSKLRQDLEHYFSSLGIKAEVVAETQDTSLQKILGTNGVGILPISQPAVQELVRRGDLVMLGTLAGVSEELFLVSSSRRIENPISSRLLKTFSI
ncbi:LysR family transcriptional regulator [bacterium]|nr:LysR family transcriptional regulator [bacterium]